MLTSKQNVLLYQAKLPDYRIGVFALLALNLNVKVVTSVSYDVLLREELEKSVIRRRTKWFFKGRLYSQPIDSVIKDKVNVVICGYSLRNVTMWKLLALKPILGYKLVLWSHGIRNNLLFSENRSFRQKIVMMLYKVCDAALFYSDLRRGIVVGNNRHLSEKSFVARNTLDTIELSRSMRQMLRREREEVKNSLKIKSLWNIAYIGRLEKAKRIDLLISAHNILRDKYSLGLVVIGDGSESKIIEEYRRVCCESVVQTGYINDVSESSKYLYSSDILVMPGYVGLGIVHGFAFGLPMITCRSTENGPFHSPEIEYLKDGYNGFFCDSTPESIAACIERLILDPELLARMKENALETVRTEANVERMIDGFRQAIDYVTRDDK